jgi:16S rRNA (cytosine1402-N4)-methyltransferase
LTHREYSHTPVLLEPVVALLGSAEREFFLVDATLGEGGHAEAMLSAYPGLRLAGVEADAEVREIARRRLERFGERVEIYGEWFDEFFRAFSVRFSRRPDRIFFDLGISMHHFTRSGRGFSFQREEPLDMRIRQDEERTAADLVNQAPAEDLEKLIREYGEERLAARIARAIARERSSRPIRTSRELAQVIWNAVPAGYRHGRIHPATRTFQALRIAVNDELGRLERALEDAFRLLAVEGRIGVIAFHSLEDRIVKHFFRQKNRTCTCPPELPVCRCGGKREAILLTPKPLSASEEEKRDNPASRSAHLRVVQKVAS